MDLRERQGEDPWLRHPWEEARLTYFSAVLKSYLKGKRNLKVLDIGAGDAWFAEQLSRQFPGSMTTCVDAHYDEEVMASLRHRRPSTLAFARDLAGLGKHDLVLMLDVLEHVDDDRALLTHVVGQCLNGESRMLITVPAWQWLYSSHDTALKHYRRYSGQQAKQLVTSCGLEVLQSGYAFHSLLLPRALSVLIEKIGSAPEVKEAGLAWNGGAAGHALVTGILNAEGRVSRSLARFGSAVPGLSWWCVASPVAGGC